LAVYLSVGVLCVVARYTWSVSRALPPPDRERSAAAEEEEKPRRSVGWHASTIAQIIFLWPIATFLIHED